MKAGELPLYSEENEEKYIIELKEPNAIQTTLDPIILKASKAVTETFPNLKAKSLNTYTSYSNSSSNFVDTYLKNPVFLARSAFISICGLGGIILGHKGGAFRKISYSAITGGTAAAFCYPKQSIELVHKAWELSKEQTGTIMTEFKKNSEAKS